MNRSVRGLSWVCGLSLGVVAIGCGASGEGEGAGERADQAVAATKLKGTTKTTGDFNLSNRLAITVDGVSVKPPTATGTDEIIEYKDGDESFARTRPGQHKAGKMVVRKDWSNTLEWYSWRKNVASGQTDRKSVSVIFHNDAGQEAGRIDYEGAQPCVDKATCPGGGLAFEFLSSTWTLLSKDVAGITLDLSAVIDTDAAAISVDGKAVGTTVGSFNLDAPAVDLVAYLGAGTVGSKGSTTSATIDAATGNALRALFPAGNASPRTVGLTWTDAGDPTLPAESASFSACSPSQLKPRNSGHATEKLELSWETMELK